ncbi:hypothetical protein [Aquibacillus salsiterrae]|uniref:Cell filamentation protein Fic n=1 Tax=Aquibacillus salsiterrae TaxID=2950439 RepID=A0A9X3WJ66_9BACI|nr:hypothetical protein [Aquibacillus salsiterrae]MDC3418339.1 hypothetical protein [Aquibacillus salsiterrae]
MGDKTKILIYQIEESNTKIDVRFENETVWMTQKAIADLYQKGVNTVNEHIKSVLKFMDQKECSKYFTVKKEEGSRKIKRNIIHYNLDVVFNIALRGQHFEQFNRFIMFAKENGINKDFLTVVPIKEREFGELLMKSLEGIVEVIPQYRIDKYIVDFYLPDLSLVVEYDEKHLKKAIERGSRATDIY